MRLNRWPAKIQARVVDVDVDSAARLRARELGLRPGALIRITQRTLFAGTVVDVAGTRLALDPATAAAIRVEPLAATQCADSCDRVTR